MANNEVRQTPGATAVPAAARLGTDRSAITRDWMWQLGLEGRLFVAGSALEGTDLTSRTALADTTPDIVLKSPSNGSTIVVPLYFEAHMTGEGGAAPDWYLAYVSTDIAIATAGTEQVAHSLLGAKGATAQADIQVAATMAAFTNADNVILRTNQNFIDNFLSLENNATDAALESLNGRMTTIDWQAPVPIPMKDGASFMFHGVTATAGTVYSWTLYWAELEAASHI